MTILRMVVLCEYCGHDTDSADCFYYCMGPTAYRPAVENCTPHVIDVVVPGQPEGRRYFPSGQVARVEVTHTDDGYVDGLPVRRVVYGDITGLPEPDGHTTYL